MNKIFLSGCGILIIIISTLSFFYYRDVVKGNGVRNSDCLPRNLEFKEITLKCKGRVADFWKMCRVCKIRREYRLYEYDCFG